MKVAILFCFVAIACVVQAKSDNKVRDAFIARQLNKLEQDKIQLFNQTEAKIEQATLLIMDIINDNDKIASTIIDVAINEVQKIINELSRNIKRKVRSVKNRQTDFNECTKMSQRWQQSSLTMITNSIICIDNDIIEAKTLINAYKKIANETTTKIAIARAKCNNCLKKVNGLISLGQASLCVSSVIHETNYLFDKEVPAVFADFANIIKMENTLPLLISNCTSSLSTITKNPKILNEVNVCLSAKIQEAKKIKAPVVSEGSQPQTKKIDTAKMTKAVATEKVATKAVADENSTQKKF